ncbi:hypothetical protein L226DRAFT_394674 [Lentinus tigrinus ALCF2SS1-7]|uniref:uncharacterized protein n=1 Tax=Lentinus tigrinus ALCF2SS1-7 TaxID=1328758 RepID=UPI0011663ACE|nr:hypothetical protein L226DRAFT_394674 [Lentinus tigrinus ALCF2SS1-7]
MFQPTRPLSPMLPATLRTTPCVMILSAALSRRMSAAALPVEHPHTPSFNVPILDIFDAPARLGESSRLLVLNAAAASSRPARSLSTQASSRRPGVKPLPAPIVLEGPARPRGMAYISFRAHRPRPIVEPRSLPARLPPPILFDGPSQLRPYVRGARRSSGSVSLIAFRPALLWDGMDGGANGDLSYQTSMLMKSVAPLFLAASAAVVLFSIDLEAQSGSQPQRQRSGRPHDA